VTLAFRCAHTLQPTTRQQHSKVGASCCPTVSRREARFVPMCSSFQLSTALLRFACVPERVIDFPMQPFAQTIHWFD